MFKRVDTNIDLASVETEISEYWDNIQAFQTSLENRKDKEDTENMENLRKELMIKETHKNH